MSRVVNLDQLYQVTRGSYEHLWAKAKSLYRDVKLYLHWSAGRYNTVFDDYHVNITGDGKIYITTENLAEVKAHTWRRNTGAVGISLCCAYGATTNDLGRYAPTAKQIEAMSQVIAVMADALDLTIDIKRVLTHGEAADNQDGYYGAYGKADEYGPLHTVERWDLQFLGTKESPVYLRNYSDPRTGGNVLRGKANWYRAEWRTKPSTKPYKVPQLHIPR